MAEELKVVLIVGGIPILILGMVTLILRFIK